MLQAQIQAIDATGDKIEVWGKLVASGNYTTGQGGDWVNLTRQAVTDSGVSVPAATLDSTFQGLAETVFSSQVPQQFDVWSEGGTLAYQYCANLANCTGPGNLQVKFGANATFGTELATGAYPAAITGDTIAFYAIFKKHQ